MNFLQTPKPEPPPVVKANGLPQIPTAAPIVSYVEHVTPEAAAVYLQSKNELNRNLSQSFIKALMADMAEGRWELTGQAIIFDVNGRLIDGHHRLTAVSRGTATVPMLIVRNAKPEAVRRIDTGVTRTAAHIAHMDGQASANQATTTMRLILIHERFGIDQLDHPPAHPTKSEIVDELRRHPAVLASVRKGQAVSKKRWCSTATAAFCHYYFHQQNPVACELFWTALAGDGSGLKATDPVLHLRNRLAGRAKADAKERVNAIIHWFFKAWVSYRDRKPMKQLRINDGEKFPQI